MVLIYVLSLLFLVSLTESAVSPAQKTQLIDAHNQYRRNVAQGKVSGQPEAADMLELKWSDAAAAKAQSYVNNCKFGHDQSSARKYGGFSWVGQNIAYWHSDDVTEGVKMWFDEVKDYNYQSNKCKKVCGHYTAIVWAKTKEFGCGIADCKSKGLGKIYLVCNYAPGGNMQGEKVYESGKACSKCPSGTKCNNGLCA